MSEKQVTGVIRQYCVDVKSDVLSKVGKNSFEFYKPMSYIEKGKETTIYCVKIQVSSEATGYIHVKISKTEDGLPTCKDVLADQTENNPLSFDD